MPCSGSGGSHRRVPDGSVNVNAGIVIVLAAIAGLVVVVVMVMVSDVLVPARAELIVVGGYVLGVGKR